MRKVFTLSFFLFAFLINISAQNKTKITGLVKDETSKPLQSISVSLLKAKDSSLVKVAVTGTDGKYEFENIANGNYFVTVTSVGYEKKMSSVFSSTASVEVTALQLTPTAKSLGG
jgi:predicted phage tail protein